MTCFDMYVSEHSFPVVGCPHEYGYLPQRPADCYCISCFKDCWAREIPETEHKKKASDVK